MMGASRLKPLTVKEIEKLTATKPSSIKHRYLGGVPGFVMVHSFVGFPGGIGDWAGVTAILPITTSCRRPIRSVCCKVH